ncbi:hypothetical protein GCM10009759_10500 [Kitasatospora saccharophila]|uniref:Uncharacterized protein n=1 Tax=Kitasatospora saccharophila TaxID=407973 RepID=A0ABN2WBF6_9ACTN
MPSAPDPPDRAAPPTITDPARAQQGVNGGAPRRDRSGAHRERPGGGPPDPGGWSGQTDRPAPVGAGTVRFIQRGGNDGGRYYELEHLPSE